MRLPKINNLFYVFAFLLNIGITRGQSIPDFEPTKYEYEKQRSLVFDKFGKKYDFIISYTKECYWPTGEIFYILAYRHKKWSLIKWHIQFKDRRKTKDNIVRSKKEKIHINQTTVDSIVNYLNENKFWSLNTGLVNSKYNDSTKTFIGISDGCTERFEIIKNEKYLTIFASNADYYQRVLPVKERQLFIICRNKILEQLKIKR